MIGIFDLLILVLIWEACGLLTEACVRPAIERRWYYQCSAIERALLCALWPLTLAAVGIFFFWQRFYEGVSSETRKQ